MDEQISNASDPETVWRATGLESPVFFDERGHRARLVRLGGALVALLVTAWLGLVIAGPVGFARLSPALTAPIVHRIHVVSGLHRSEDRDTTHLRTEEVESPAATGHAGARARS